MSESNLEQRVNESAIPSRKLARIRERLVESWDRRDELWPAYRHKWVEFFKDMAPAIVAGGLVAGATTAYTGANDSSTFVQTISPYAGYLAGYPTYFATHYYRHRDEFPGFFSKAYANHVGHFLAADYLSDPVFASPVLLGLSYGLGKTDTPDFIVGATASVAASLSWMSAMCVVQPTMERASAAVTAAVKTAAHVIYRLCNGTNNRTNSNE